MNIRKDKELNILAKAAGKKATEVETIIVNQLIQKEMIQDDPEFWGCTLFDSIERDVPVSDVVGIIKATGISVTFRTFGCISEFGIGRKRRLPGMWRRNGSYRRRL